MKIALIAPVEESVPPQKYGGTERVVDLLAKELVKLGHDVTLFASGDSKTTAKLVVCSKYSVRTMPAANNSTLRRALNLQGLSKALDYIKKHDFDIIHNHFGWEFLLFSNLTNSAHVTTLHGSLNKKLEPTVYKMHGCYKKSPVISISNSQRKHSPCLNYVGTVYNGIDLDHFDFNEKPKDYLAFLGRIHPQKGPDKAIEIAKKTNHKLIMAAKIDPIDYQYFVKKVKPLIDNKQIVYIGEVNQKKKINLLKNAKALISPITWDEPFGMVNIESLACGTPVITINRGSIPEILNKKVAFLCKDTEEMIKKVSKINEIDRKECRRHVENHFSSKLMAQNYLKIYKKIINEQANY